MTQKCSHLFLMVVWDYVSFHPWCPYTKMVQHQPAIFLPPYYQSSTIQPFSLEFFSAWQWKVYDQNPYTRVNLLQAMVLAFCDIGVECFQGWIQHTRGFLLRCFVVLCWQYWVVMVTVILWCNSTAVIGLVFHYPCFPGNALVPTTACQWHSMDYVNHYIR